MTEKRFVEDAERKLIILTICNTKNARMLIQTLVESLVWISYPG